MQNEEKVLIGVAWPYVNGDIHPGHIAGNFLPADIFARYQRNLGKEVLMVSGSDCYGTPITVEADKRQKKYQEIVNEYHPHHLELFKTYGISFDHYTQTTNLTHRKVVQELLLKLAKNGYLFKEETPQYFSPEENKFLPDRYVEGSCNYCGYKEARGDQCDNCGRVLDFSELKNPVNKLTKKPVELKATEHLFLNWPKLQGFLEKYVESHRAEWKTWIYNEVAGWLKKGLKPRAVTRDINWGVEIPNDKLPQELQLKDHVNKRIYVWFEAVIGYLSAAEEFGGNWEEFWFPKSMDRVRMYNFMGKDNVVFHALFWPGQLYASYGDKIKLPDIISANQFLNLEGKKFSKSRGVTIDSVYLAKRYGADPVRFYLTYIMPENADADFAWDDFVNFNNNVLINTFGNFINRVLKLSESVDFSKLQTKIETSVQTEITKAEQTATKHLDNCEFKLYAQRLIDLARFGNEYIAKNEPWKLAKTDEHNYHQVMGNSLQVVLTLLSLMGPLIPESTKRLETLLGLGSGETKPVLTNVKVTKAEPLFAKIDPEVVEEEKSKINL